MYRATTPLHVFTFDVDLSEYPRVFIVYAQGDKIILRKRKEDLTFESHVTDTGLTKYTASLKLSQEEANKFKTYYGTKVSVQVRVLDDDGNAYASEIRSFPLKDVLVDEVLKNG